MPLTVTVKCVSSACGAKKEIDPRSVEPDDVPACDKCSMPMVVVKATRRAR